MQMLFLICAVLLGLIIGSFLNVVIYRLPLMLQQEWRAQCIEFLHQTKHEIIAPINLVLPRSHCPYCKKMIPFWHNIPVISYLLLRGKCKECGNKISWRYPLVEILSAVATLFIAYHYGWQWQTLFAVIFTWALLAGIFIDIEHQLLPDEITLGLLWLGLLVNLTHLFAPITDAIIGAVAGYVSLWIIGWLFKKIRGIEGIGYGDYKLLAALGAWVGWQLLPLIVLISALLGAIIGMMLIGTKKIRRQTPIPFGPFLAIAGWFALIYGQDILNFYWRWLG